MTQTLNNITLESLSRIATQLSKYLEPGICVCLWGDLGAGKSTFSRMIIQSLNPEITDVPSPTFTLIQQYDTSAGEIWHCDLYRLKHPDEIQELGLEDAFFNAITLIEWPEKMGYYLPANRLDIRLTIDMNAPKDLRTMTIQCEGDVDIDLDLKDIYGDN